MKTFFKKFAVFVALILAAFATVSLTAAKPTFAAEVAEGQVYDLGDCRHFLGMPSWDCNVTDINSTDSLKNNVVLIVANILTAITVAATYLVIGYTIYGGYLYIFSNGDPGKAASGKKTLTRAFIGLAVVASANVILNTIRAAFVGASGAFSSDCLSTQCVSPVSFVANALNWFIGTAGIVAVIFLVTGGIGYITSAGDSGKLQKAKTTIIYSLIGLAIVGLALGAVGLVSSIANGAVNPTP